MEKNEAGFTCEVTPEERQRRLKRPRGLGGGDEDEGGRRAVRRPEAARDADQRWISQAGAGPQNEPQRRRGRAW